MKKRSFGKLIKRDPHKAFDHVCSNLKKYSFEDLEKVAREMHIPVLVFLRIKGCLVSHFPHKRLLLQKKNISLMKTMFSLYQRLKVAAIPINGLNKNFQVEPEFGGGDVFKKRRRPINKQAARGIKGLTKTSLR
ncbi:MAG: hypothetical protein ACOX0H_01915 [Patescibacteria group bacterium]|jgi:hypothetical protein|nr:hypothetical protein [bacterium]HQC49815.1 hypothetical protein [bacterium]